MTKNEAIAMYLKAQSKIHGLGSVIIVPEFDGDDTIGWTPVGDGVRATKKGDTSFIRLGSVVLGDGLRTAIRLTNNFMPTDELVSTLDALCATAGSKIPGKLIAHERLTPFRRTNGDLDLKWADKSANLPCLVDDQPIYRRIEHTMDTTKSDVLVQHTNGQAISEHARKVWMSNNANPAQGLEAAAEGTKRLAELKAIPSAKRTAEQKLEIAELMEA